MLAAYFSDFHPRIGFFEDRHNLALCVLALFHRFVCFLDTKTSHFNLFHLRGLLHRELGYFFCSLVHKSIYWGGKKEKEYDNFPGRSWSFEEFLFAIQAPLDQVPRNDGMLRFRKRGNYDFSWFIPILEKLTKGIPVSYQEANDAYQVAHGGKNLRLFPGPEVLREYYEYYLANIDYNY